MNNFRMYRLNANMSLKEVGRHLGVSESTVSNYETGRREPSIEILHQYSSLFGVTVDQLLGKSETANAGRRSKNDEMIESIRRNPNLIPLFDKVKNAKKDEIDAIGQIIDVLQSARKA